MHVHSTHFIMTCHVKPFSNNNKIKLIVLDGNGWIGWFLEKLGIAIGSNLGINSFMLASVSELLLSAHISWLGKIHPCLVDVVE